MGIERAPSGGGPAMPRALPTGPCCEQGSRMTQIPRTAPIEVLNTKAPSKYTGKILLVLYVCMEQLSMASALDLGRSSARGPGQKAPIFLFFLGELVLVGTCALLVVIKWLIA